MPQLSYAQNTSLLNVLALAALIFPITTSAGGALNIQQSAPYDKDLDIPRAVRTDCELEKKIPEFVQAAAKKQFDSIELVDKAPGSGKSLSMKIIGLQGTAGGAWTGPKALKISGELRENGKVVGSFKASRTSGGGAFGGYKGTCSILGRSAKALGKDVARWLEDPVKDALLGEYK